MKKTIAKFMAAAMLLSAVPAVTMPSFVSKAGSASSATNTTTVSAAQNFVQGGDLIPAKSGELFAVRMDANSLNTALAASAGGVDTTKSIKELVKPSAVATGNASTAFINLVNTELVQSSADPNVYSVKVSAKSNMTTSEKTILKDAIKGGTNCFKIKITVATAANGGSDNQALKTYLNKAETSYTGDKVFWIGGQYVNGMMRTAVVDDANLLQDGNVYAKIDKTSSDGDTLAEIELVKQAKTEGNKLKDNDNLRGNTLDLSTMTIGGIKFKVGKLGSQCLKEAKMKKLLAKNVSKVYKGACRKCKQLKTVNMKDKNKIRKINTKAFYNCKNLHTIIIDGRKLNTVGKDAFKGLKKNCKIKIKASKSKYNADVKKIKKANKTAVLKFARIAP